MNQTMGEHPPEAGSAAGNGNAPHDVRADLKAYLDGELSGLHRWLTARHLARCASCRGEMRRLEYLGRQVQMLDQAMPASHLRARILASLPVAPPAPAPVVSRFRPADARSFAARSRHPLSAAMGLCALLLMVGAFALARYGYTGATGGDTDFTAKHGVTSGPIAVNSTPSTTLPGSVQELAVNPSRPVMPARTQSDPSAPDTIAQIGGKDGSGASQHPTPTNTDDTNNESSSQPTATEQATYSDPTSAAADRIAATIIPDKLREKRQVAGADHAPASIHSSIPIVKMAAPAPMQMAVAVADVSEASRQVRKWAEQAGAQVTVMPSKTIKTSAGLQSSDGTSDAAHTAYDTHTGTGGSSVAPAAELPVPQTAILRLQVPVQRAAGFEAYLSQMAKAAGAAAHTKGEEINAVRDLKTDAVATRPYPMAAHVLDGEPVVPRKHSATITIFVRLQPENSASRP